jgi:hypothetical protein
MKYLTPNPRSCSKMESMVDQLGGARLGLIRLALLCDFKRVYILGNYDLPSYVF